MKRVYQTGSNCFAACVASITERDINREASGNQWMVPGAWFDKLQIIYARERIKLIYVYSQPLDTFYIGIYAAKTKGSHAVVMYNGVIVHDPAGKNSNIDLNSTHTMIIVKKI
jgi:hypothetical protein